MEVGKLGNGYWEMDMEKWKLRDRNWNSKFWKKKIKNLLFVVV